ncbi:NUDIX hydrolase [bacterium]|nr:NUDIX hydrolase [bacterium]
MPEDSLRILPPQKGAPPAQAFQVETPDGGAFFAYAHPHPAITATVVLWDRRRRAALLVRRAHEPYQGQWCFPGGFLEVGKESLEETAAREISEETSLEISPDRLRLLDVRSAPDRDPRDHVVDVGFFVQVESAEARAGDDAAEVRWASEEEMAGLPLAFDHALLWRRVVEGRVIAG